MAKWKSEGAKLLPRGVSECPTCQGYVGDTRICAYCHFEGWKDIPKPTRPPEAAIRRAAGAPTLPASATCSKCGRGVVWVFTREGKKLPIDPAPVRHAPGRVQLQGGVAYFPSEAQRESMLDLFGLYPVHFDTCAP